MILVNNENIEDNKEKIEVLETEEKEAIESLKFEVQKSGIYQLDKKNLGLRRDELFEMVDCEDGFRGVLKPKREFEFKFKLFGGGRGRL